MNEYRPPCSVSSSEPVSETYKLERELLQAVAAVEYWIKVASDHGADIVSLSNVPHHLPRTAGEAPGLQDTHLIS